MELGIIVKTLIALALWFYCYPKGYCDWCLPNTLKSKKHHKADKHHIAEIKRLLDLYGKEATAENLVKWSGFNGKIVDSALKLIEKGDKP